MMEFPYSPSNPPVSTSLPKRSAGYSRYPLAEWLSRLGRLTHTWSVFAEVSFVKRKRALGQREDLVERFLDPIAETLTVVVERQNTHVVEDFAEGLAFGAAGAPDSLVHALERNDLLIDKRLGYREPLRVIVAPVSLSR